MTTLMSFRAIAGIHSNCHLRKHTHCHPRNLLSRIQVTCHPQLDWGSSPNFFKYNEKRRALRSKIEIHFFRSKRISGDILSYPKERFLDRQSIIPLYFLFVRVNNKQTDNTRNFDVLRDKVVYCFIFAGFLRTFPAPMSVKFTSI